MPANGRWDLIRHLKVMVFLFWLNIYEKSIFQVTAIEAAPKESEDQISFQTPI